jgi:REP element-mobilizing transposase RayT
MADSPVAYFITFSCYGTWLHGRAPGSVDPQHNQFGASLLPTDRTREALARQTMRESPYVLDAERRALVLKTIREVAIHRGWTLIAVHVRSTHVHVIVQAAATPEKVMSDFKAYASRRLKEAFGEPADRKRWTEHGSTRYLWKEEDLPPAIRYVVAEQGQVMEVYQASEPEA